MSAAFLIRLPMFAYFAIWLSTGWWGYGLAVWLVFQPLMAALVWKRDFGYWQFWRDTRPRAVCLDYKPSPPSFPSRDTGQI